MRSISRITTLLVLLSGASSELQADESGNLNCYSRARNTSPITVRQPTSRIDSVTAATALLQSDVACIGRARIVVGHEQNSTLAIGAAKGSGRVRILDGEHWRDSPPPGVAFAWPRFVATDDDGAWVAWGEPTNSSVASNAFVVEVSELWVARLSRDGSWSGKQKLLSRAVLWESNAVAFTAMHTERARFAVPLDPLRTAGRSGLLLVSLEKGTWTVVEFATPHLTVMAISHLGPSSLSVLAIRELSERHNRTAGTHFEFALASGSLLRQADFAMTGRLVAGAFQADRATGQLVLAAIIEESSKRYRFATFSLARDGTTIRTCAGQLMTGDLATPHIAFYHGAAIAALPFVDMRSGVGELHVSLISEGSSRTSRLMVGARSIEPRILAQAREAVIVVASQDGSTPAGAPYFMHVLPLRDVDFGSPQRC